MQASRSKRHFHPALVIAALTAPTGCALQSPDEPRPAKTWDYRDGPSTVGPAAWGTMPGYELCGAGAMQSPVALETSESSRGAAPPLRFDYRPSELKVIDTGRTMSVSYPSGSTMSVGEESYELSEIHFHARSEHTIDGVSYPLEMHMVHLDRYRQPTAVVAVFFRQGAASDPIATMLSNLPPRRASAEPAYAAAAPPPAPGQLPFVMPAPPEPATLDAMALLPADRSYIAYQGSLSTPPCSENVTWFVLTQPMQASAEQLAAYAGTPGFAGTNRPAQPMNCRSAVLHDSSAGAGAVERVGAGDATP